MHFLKENPILGEGKPKLWKTASQQSVIETGFLHQQLRLGIIR